jgi:Tol biopolymer transport system component
MTFHESSDFGAIWSTDGASVVFSSSRGGSANLWRKSVDGTGDAERLTDAGNFEMATGWLADGGILLFTEFASAAGSRDLMLLDLETGEVEAYLQTEFNEWWGRPSPDGRWVAYVSNESGQREVYVRPYPRAAGKWQISSGGGEEEPKWSPDGSTLYYWGLDDQVHAVDVVVDGSSFRASSPRVLPAVPFAGSDDPIWTVAPDGSFVFLSGEQAESEGEALPYLVFNWFEELTKLVPLEN